MTGDPEFQRAMLIVLGAGSAVAAIATIVLFLLFRRFGGKAHMGLIVALMGFIFLVCVGLFLVSHE
jgi:hypothetical protein